MAPFDSRLMLVLVITIASVSLGSGSSSPTTVSTVSSPWSVGDDNDDLMPYNVMLWPGTHNSAINMGDGTLLRPSDAVGGEWPSEAHSPYQYVVMDQRVSVRDQLEQGIRVIDLEVADLTSTDWPCADGDHSENSEHSENSAHSENSEYGEYGKLSERPVAPVEEGQAHGSATGAGQCVEKFTLHGRCFEDCPFIISHGSVQESIKAAMGYTFPEAVFSSVAEYVEAHPREVVTILMMATHGNTAPSAEDMISRLDSSGLLEHVWNYDPEADAKQAFALDVGNGWPTLGEMRDANKTVLLASNYGLLSGSPSMTSSYVDASDITSGDTDSTCQTDDGTHVPCLEGWDAVTFEQQSPSKAVLGADFAASQSLFAIENLSSRRGRDDHSTDYWPIPNEVSDFPFQAGGNPYQGQLAANYSHVIDLEARWSRLLAPYGMVPNWLLVDFFNTTCPESSIARGQSSRTLLPNPSEGLIEAAEAINKQRRAKWASRGRAN